MPLEVADIFKPNASPAGTAGTGVPPAKPPAASPSAGKGPGLDISEVFKSQTPPPTIRDKASAFKRDRADPVIKGVKEGLGEFSNQALVPYITDANQWAKEYSDALHQDLKAYPEGTGDQLLQSLKTANDALAYATGPIMSPIYTGIINPVKAAIARVGGLVEKHAAEDLYDAQARREGKDPREIRQRESKAWDLAVHKRDVTEAVQSLQTASESLINAATMFIPTGKKLAPGEHPPVSDVKLTAEARTAIRDVQSAVKPPEPKLEPIAVSIDKSMGFGAVEENIGKKVLMQIQPGSTRTVGALLDDMIPHAEGYAKSFLQKLNEHIDPNIPVRFKETAGNNPAYKGVYMPDVNQIELKTRQEGMIHTSVHEMVHGATIHMIDTLLEGDMKAAAEIAGRALTSIEKLKVVDSPSNPILRELDSAIKEARIRAQKAGRGDEFYGLKSSGLPRGKNLNLFSHTEIATKRMSPRYEFVAEVFSNPKLQEFLANSEKYASVGYKFKNILTQFGNLIAKHLGMTGANELRLLNQAMRVGTRLIELQGTEKPPANRSMVQIMARAEDGTTITRGDMQRATQEVGRLLDRQGLKRAKTALALSVEGILRAVAPEALGRNAKLGAAVVASRIAELMQKTSAWRHGSETRLGFWRLRPDMVAEFLEKFEKGQTFSDPVLADLAKRYREWNKNIFDQDTKITGLDYEPRDNYLYHIFEDSEGVSNYFTRKYGTKWGDPRFIKDRTFDLYKEAIAAGFRPKFDNPEDIMLARQHASDSAAMHQGILQDLERYGLATKKVKGGTFIDKSVDAEGKVTWGQRTVKGTSQPENTTRWRAPNGDVYWVDNKAAIILENAFKSKSLWEDKSMMGMGFRSLMFLKNAIVPIRLALSLFHPLHVTGIDMAAGYSRATVDFMSGQISAPKALGRMLKSSFNPLYEGVKDGWRVMNVWKGKVPEALLTDADAEALKYIVEGGMIPEMSTQYRINSRQSFGAAVRDAIADIRQLKPGAVAGDAVRATWHLPWALISAIQAPIFEHWIPALKTASYLKDVKSLLSRNPQLVEDDAARQLALRRLAKSVDNRYGEMAYNTLFWKRYIKDVAVLDTLSLGWQLGFIREYGGGAIDLGQFAGGGSRLQRIKAGQLDRPLFVAAYTALGAMTAGLMTWAMTGETPTSLLDYISPRTGEKNPDGSEQRVSTMFYSREFAALYKHMQNEGTVAGVSKMVMNKGSGLFGLMHEWATGVNDFGQEIRDPGSDAFQQLQQTLAYTLTDMEPISMKSVQEQVSQEPVKTGVLSALGFTPAPKYLTESATTAGIKLAYDKYVAPKQTPYDKAQYSQEFKKLRDLYQSGDAKFSDAMDQVTEKFGLSAHDQRRMIKSLNSDIPPEVRMFMRLPWQEQKKLLDKMTDEERELFLPHSNREHVRNVYEPPAQ